MSMPKTNVMIIDAIIPKIPIIPIIINYVSISLINFVNSLSESTSLKSFIVNSY